MNRPAFEILRYDTLDSTNEEAKRLLNAGQIQGLKLIQARQQTAGKGTQGRQWISPADSGLYLSIVHPFACFSHATQSIPVTPFFTLAAGVACAEALHELTGVEIHLKPVNDLYVAGCKLGGILTESILGQAQGKAVCRAIITGIGINIYTHAAVEALAKNDDEQHQQAACQTESADGVGSQSVIKIHKPRNARSNRDKTPKNTPTSLQACLPPQIFERWQGETIREELSEALARTVDARYQQLITGDAPGIVRQYMQAKLPGVELPAEIARLLPPGCLPVC